MNPAVLAMVAASVTLNAMAQIALRKTMLVIGSPPAAPPAILAYTASIGFNPWFLAGMTCYVVSLGLWLLVLAKLEVSMAFPLGALGYILTAAAGYLYLGENVTPMRLSGIALIILGIAVISRSG